LNAKSYVELRVYTRLVERGVDPPRAEGVARKVARRYEQRRQERLALGTYVRS
jgi:hypothetical protein